jgi:hypothetical protein
VNADTKQQRAKQAGATTTQMNDTIRSRAYELYEQRGRADGHELDDWVQAESEVLGPQSQVKAA